MRLLAARLFRNMFFALVLVAAAAAPAARAEEVLRGVALVIGQSAYESLPALPNAASDARAIDRLLSDLGFDVDVVPDGDRRRLDRAFERFVEDAADADVALVYYAGHGVEAGGENYIVPVDAASPEGGVVADLVPVSAMLAELQSKAPIAIVLLDACRDNPYPPGTLVAGAGGSAAAVSATGLGQPRGAASLRNTGPETLGAMIGFAAEPGRAALDGPAGTNSPYAAALIKHLAASGRAFGDVMTMVSEEVYLKTGGRQLPWTNASLRRLLYFGLDAEEKSGDEHAIREGRRALLLTIATTPPDTRQMVEQVAAANDVPLDALYGMLEVLGVDTASGDITEQLTVGAGRLKSIVAARDVQAQTDPEIVRLASLADRAEGEGAMALALDFRAKASVRADQIDSELDKAEANIADRRRELAATYRSHAETASLNFDFATAAARYGDAFAQIERLDVPLAYKLKVLQGEALNDQGVYQGDNQALIDSVTAYEQALEIGRGNPNVRRDAALKGNIAIVLTQLGSRSGDASHLDKAVRLYGEVAKALPRKRYPEDWAYTQLNLGALHQALADRGGGNEQLDLALKAYQGSARIFTHEAAPEQWAGLQMNIGNVYAQLANRGAGSEPLRRSIAAMEAALAVWTREAYPVNWALAQSNLATSLRSLGAMEKDEAMLRRAIATHLSALEVTTRERQPTSWAGDMNNLGSDYLELAEINGDVSLFEQAVNAFRQARVVLTRDLSPTDYAATMINEARALLRLGRRQGDVPFLKQAMAVLDPPMQIMAEQQNPIGWARVRSIQGEYLAEIGRREGNREALVQARAAFEEARKLFADNGMGETGQGFWQKQIAAIDQELAR
jgi:uncharacterized caspase-like protein